MECVEQDRPLRIALAFVLAALLPACVLAPRGEPLVLDGYETGAARRIAVLPFGGAGYPRITADWIAFRLAERGTAEIVPPEQAAALLRDAGRPWTPGDEPAAEVIREAARVLRADVVVCGGSERATGSAVSQPQFASALRVWDGATGRKLGTTTTFGGFVLGSSDYPIAHAAAGRAATELERVLLGEPARKEE